MSKVLREINAAQQYLFQSFTQLGKYNLMKNLHTVKASIVQVRSKCVHGDLSKGGSSPVSIALRMHRNLPICSTMCRKKINLLNELKAKATAASGTVVAHQSRPERKILSPIYIVHDSYLLDILPFVRGNDAKWFVLAHSRKATSHARRGPVKSLFPLRRLRSRDETKIE